MSIRLSFYQLFAVFVVLSVLCLNLFSVPVMAQVNDISYFNDEEVSLINENSPIMLLASVDGFSFSQKYNDGSNSYTFDTSVPKNANMSYMYVQINFPENIPRKQLFDLTVRMTHSKATGFDPKAMTLYEDGQGTSKSIKSYLTYEHANGETILRFKDVSADFIASHCILRYEYIGYTTTAEFVHNIASINLEYVPDSGLISGILQGILNLPGLIADAFASFFDIIVEGLDYIMQAVYDMGDLIVGALIDLKDMLLDGIKNLFVPTQEDLVNIKNDWDSLLSERFGALYDVIELIDEYANTFTSTSKTSITIPSISVPLAGSIYNFGGQTVQVVPDGFDVLISALKMIISILATCLFINGLRNRFEKVVGSE